MRFADAALITLLITVFAMVCMAYAAPASRVVPPAHDALVGFGCAGAGGPLYAAEEDHLPRCDKIQRR